MQVAARILMCVCVLLLGLSVLMPCTEDCMVFWYLGTGLLGVIAIALAARGSDRAIGLSLAGLAIVLAGVNAYLGFDRLYEQRRKRIDQMSPGPPALTSGTEASKPDVKKSPAHLASKPF